MELVDFVNGLENQWDKGLYRRIKVMTPKGKKKVPKGERSDWSKEQILNQRCGVPDPNAYSIYMKHIPDLFCVDFDSKNTENDLYKRLTEDKCFMTETTKGFHFFPVFKNVGPFKNEVNVGNPDYFAQDNPVDLIYQKRNVWEIDGRIVSGETISEYDWSDVSKYFDTERMNFQQPVVVQAVDVAPEVVADPEFAMVEETFPKCAKEEFMELLGRVNDSRCDDYDSWLQISMIIFNNFRNDPDGYSIFKEWSSKSASYDESANKIKWQSFAVNPPENKLSYRSLMRLADQDNPLNVLQKIYDKKGERAMIEFMNRTLCYKRDTSEYIWVPEQGSLKLQIKNRAAISEDFANMCWTYKQGDKILVKDPAKMYRTSKFRKEVARIDFDPSPDAPDDIFNLWTGYHINKDNAIQSNRADALLTHIRKVWCNNNQEQYDYVLNWFAWLLQFPEKKIGVMLALYSRQGAGKGIVLMLMAFIMDGFKDDGYFGQYSSIESICGSYSYGLEGKQLINFDEAFWGGNKSLEGQMKNLITETKQEIKKKYAAPYFIKNSTAFIVTTNNDRFVGMTEDDRRHLCLRVNDELIRRMTHEQKATYFGAICQTQHHANGEINPKVAHAFAHHLYQRDLTNFRPAVFPKTDLSQEQIMAGWNSVTRFWFEVLNSESFGVWTECKGYNDECVIHDKYYNIPSGAEKGKQDKDGNVYAFKDWVYERYNTMKLGGWAKKDAPDEFFKKTSNIFTEHYKIVRFNLSGRRIHGMKLLKEEEARKVFKDFQRYDGPMFDADTAEEVEAMIGGGNGGGYNWSDSDSD